MAEEIPENCINERTPTVMYHAACQINRFRYRRTGRDAVRENKLIYTQTKDLTSDGINAGGRSFQIKGVYIIQASFHFYNAMAKL